MILLLIDQLHKAIKVHNKLDIKCLKNSSEFEFIAEHVHRNALWRLCNPEQILFPFLREFKSTRPSEKSQNPVKWILRS